MNYTNLNILKELKHIKKCHENFGNSGRDCIDNTANCIYTDKNTGILNYLREKNYIVMQDTSVGRVTPYITSYGKDFLMKHNKLSCFIKDNLWSINVIISLIVAIIVGLIVYALTTDSNDKINLEENNFIFQKNKECSEHKDSMLEDSENKHIDWIYRTGDAYKLNIEEIFYSKVNQTCIYILTIDKFVDLVVDGKYTDYIRLNKYAYNYFSKKELFSTINLSVEEFEEKISKLKN